MDTKRILNILVYVLIVSILFVEHFSRQYLGGMGRYVTWLPELISLAFTMLFFLYLSQKKSLDLGNKYLFIFILLLLEMFIGVVINSVQPGAIFAGIRSYFKYVPFFLLPVVYRIDEEQILKYLKLILFFAILEFPISFRQRFVLHPNLSTGDVVTGTLTSSGLLSVLLLCVIAGLFTFILKKKIGKLLGLVMMIALFLPMTINETKGAFLLLPFALLVPVFITVEKQYRVKYMIPSMVLLTMLMSAFSIIYAQRAGTQDASLVNFFSSDGVQKYLYRGTEVGELNEVSRFDSISWAFQELSKDPVELLVGLGVGNVGVSFSSTLAGEYMIQFQDYGVAITTFSYLLWEVGLLGIIIILCLFINILVDAYSIKDRDGIHGLMAGMWVCVTSLVIISFVYKNLIHINAISCLFWFFSGYVLSLKYGKQKSDVELTEYSYR